MQTLDAIKTRRTIRKFTEEPVSHEVIEKIVEASAYAPSWKNKRSFFDSNKGVLHSRKTPFIPFSSDAFVHDIIKNQTIQLFRQNRTESFSLLLFQRLHLHPVSEVYVDRILFLQDPFLLQCICG